MPSPALTRSEIEIEARPFTRIGTVAEYDPDQPLEVWICDTGGGARIVQIPVGIADDVTWSDTRGAQATATFTLDRYAKDPDDDTYWLTKIPRVTSEIQIVWEGRVVHWGPVVGIKSPLGAARASITVADPQWYFGRRLTDSTESVWSRNFVSNPRFDQGFSNWTNSGGALDTGVKETGTQSVLLETGDDIQQTVQVGLTPSWRGLARARVWVEAAAVGGEFRLERSDLVQTIRAAAQVDAETPRDQWTWLTIDLVVSNPGPLPALLDLRVDGPDSGGDLWLDRIELQASPESLGIPGAAQRVQIMNPSDAAASLIATGGEGVNIAAIVDESSVLAGVDAVWLQRGDMFVSEAQRSLSDRDGGLEFRTVYSLTTRAVEALELVGVEHDPADVTLRVNTGTGAPTNGNATSLDLDGGVANPTTRVRARSEEGFFDEASDPAAWGGLVLEDVVQVPLGIGLRDLGKFANARLMDSEGLTNGLRLELSDLSLVSTLRRGDRVKVTVNDGPDVVDALHRIESITYKPGVSAAPVEVDLTVWVDPGPEVVLPRPAAALVPLTLEGVQIVQGRRLFDVERRLANAAQDTNRLEDLLDVDVAYEGVDVIADGDVLTWDEASQRWIGAEGGGGGGTADAATIRVTATFDGADWNDIEVGWDLPTGGGSPWTVLDGTGGELIEVEINGAYMVSAQLTSDSPGAVVGSVYAENRRMSGETPGPCFINEIGDEAEPSTSMAGQFGLMANDVISASAGAGVTIRLDVHHVFAADFEACPGGGEG